MQALVYTAIQKLQIQEYVMPILQANESLVKVELSGICGSDMHAWHGHDTRRQPPLVLGHEISGRVIEGKLNGSLVTANPLITCGYCQFCQGGRDNICANRTMLGMTRQGGFAEYIAVPNQCLIKLPDDMPVSSSVLTEPVAVCVHAVETAKRLAYHHSPTDRVLIIGAGAIGVLVALILQNLGYGALTLCDTNELRVNTAKTIINGEVINNKTSPLAGKYDMVFDAVGSTITRNISIQNVVDGGCVVHIGLQNDAGEFNARRLTIGEIIFVGVYTYTMQQMSQAVDLLYQNKLGNLAWLETRPLQDGQAAFTDIHNVQTSSPKIVLAT